MSAAEIVATCRARSGLSQAELAYRAGTAQSAVSAIEHGRRDPSVATLERLVRASGAGIELRAVAIETDGAARARDDAERGRRLVDVLLFADAVGRPSRRTALDAPRIVSTGVR